MVYIEYPLPLPVSWQKEGAEKNVALGARFKKLGGGGGGGGGGGSGELNSRGGLDPQGLPCFFANVLFL